MKNVDGVGEDRAAVRAGFEMSMSPVLGCCIGHRGGVIVGRGRTWGPDTRIGQPCRVADDASPCQGVDERSAGELRVRIDDDKVPDQAVTIDGK